MRRRDHARSRSSRGGFFLRRQPKFLTAYMPSPTGTKLTASLSRVERQYPPQNPERSARIGLCPPTDVEDHNGLSKDNRGRVSGAHTCNSTKCFRPKYRRCRNIAEPAPLGFPEHGYRHRSPIREDERDGHKHDGRHSKLVRLSRSRGRSTPESGRGAEVTLPRRRYARDGGLTSNAGVWAS